MSKRPTSASFPALSVEVESTPSTTPATVPRTPPAVPNPDSNPYYFPPDSDDSDSDDESSSDESLDHGGDMVFEAVNHSLSSQSVALYIF